MRFLLKLYLHILTRTAGFGDVEPTSLVEVGADGSVYQWRAGDLLDDEAFGHADVLEHFDLKVALLSVRREFWSLPERACLPSTSTTAI